MSSTQLYRVNKAGDVVHEKDFRNSFRGAYLVWKQLGEEYLSGCDSIFNPEPIWALHKNLTIPVNVRIVLKATFDRVMIKKENFVRFMQAVAGFSSEGFEVGNLSDQVYTIAELDKDDDCIAVCWNQTSVNCGVWDVETEEKDEYGDLIDRPYNIFKDTDHWFLFDEIGD